MSLSGSSDSLPNWSPKAVVFDCDGLLVDTEPCWTIAETELFRRHGRGFGDVEKALLIGRSMTDAAAVLAQEFDEIGQERALVEELLLLVNKAIGANATTMPGATRLVQMVRSALPMAVASNSPRKLMDAALDRGGLGGTFAVSLAADEVPEPKPAPDIYLEACNRLGVQPSDAVAFEDSATGLRSATAAGLRTIGIPTLKTQSLTADWVWGSLEDPALMAWVTTW